MKQIHSVKSKFFQITVSLCVSSEVEMWSIVTSFLHESATSFSEPDKRLTPNYLLSGTICYRQFKLPS